MTDEFAVLTNLVLHLEAGGTYEEFKTAPRVSLAKNEHKANLSTIERIVRVHTRNQTRARRKAGGHAHD